MSSRRRVTTRSVLSNPNYRRLFTAQTISRWGDTAATVALVVLVFRLTGTGLGVSTAIIAEILPVLLLAPIAGVLVDRMPRIRIMICADLWRAVLATTLPLVDHHVFAVYAIAFGLSAGSVFFNPAAASSLPGIVAEDELVAANSGLWSAAVISQIALAPLAGVMVAVWGVGPAFWINGASFLISALILTRLHLDRPPRSTSGEPWRARLLEGARLLARDRLLRLLAIIQLLAALSAGATSALLVVLAEQHLRTGPRGYGLLLGAIGVGAAIGPLLLTRLTTNPRRPSLIFGPYLLRGLVDLLLAATRNLPIAVTALGLYGVGTSTGMITYNSLLQAEVPDHARGRVFAGMDMIWQTGRLTSILIGALAADALGIQAVYALGGILLLIGGTLGLTGMSRRPNLGEHTSSRTEASK